VGNADIQIDIARIDVRSFNPAINLQRPTFRFANRATAIPLNRACDMESRFSKWTAGVLVVAAVALISSGAWAHWYELGASKNEWGLKYQAEVKAADGGKLNVQFTLSDQGRLKPIHSVFVMALSNPEPNGSRTYLVKQPITLKPGKDGKLTGQVEVAKKYADRAVIRIFTMTVDGRTTNTGELAGARYYDVPLKKFLKKAPPAASSQSTSSTASPPGNVAGQ
jgi:hypothetical protein